MKDLQTYLDAALKNIDINAFTVREEIIIKEYDIEEEIRMLVINARGNMEMTQSQLAKKSGISQANISKIENGSYKPGVKTLKKIANALGKRLVVDFVDEKEGY